ncbi:MAG: peptidoglycan DD-metalloendopeptidase family protein [Flavobacteriales bacterium]|nr:peptidoglycan DD-metalloendopeptidase family protein [Flavobacteriales bacterium]
MKLFIRLLLVLWSFNGLVAQNRSELQKRKKQLQEEIQWSNDALKQTKKNKNYSLSQLKTLKQKITIRAQLIETIQKEVDYIKEEIQINHLRKSSLEIELDSLKVDYANLIQQAYKNQRHFNRLLFILSSKDFQQAYKRAVYMKQIAQYRQLQAQNIKNKQADLEKSILVLEKQQKIKQNLIDNKQVEKELLSQEKSQQSSSLVALSKKEKELKEALSSKKKKRKKIQREIERIIAEELRKKTEIGSKKEFLSTPEAIALSNSFSSNKGKLPWPVSKGLIISKFGKQKHPILSGVYVENNGVEIATESHSPCRSVFKGKVSSVLTMPNGIKVIMVRHGEYISVYSNLSEVYVEKGDDLDTKQEVGLVYTSKQEGSTVVDFQLWKGGQKLNPQYWLMRK